MDTDLLLTIGILLVVLTIPSLLSAWTEGRAPRVGSILLIAGGGLIVAALTHKPGGYTFADIPTAMMSVIGRYVN
ncbi:hypothetical protein LHP98_14930 [Rhodobacter sp. Har01]|nr:hypothetical protein [Rhodobacter sp. Har01]